MNQSCPISFQRIDSNMVRLIAIQVTFVALIFLLTHHIIFLLLLCLDFFARFTRLLSLSPFSYVANKFIEHCRLEENLTNEAPKRFALYLGLTMNVSIFIFYILGFIKISMFLTFILIVFACLEAFSDYCIGCKLYYFLQHLLQTIKK